MYHLIFPLMFFKSESTRREREWRRKWNITVKLKKMLQDLRCWRFPLNYRFQCFGSTRFSWKFKWIFKQGRAYLFFISLMLEIMVYYLLYMPSNWSWTWISPWHTSALYGMLAIKKIWAFGVPSLNLIESTIIASESDGLNISLAHSSCFSDYIYLI
jgi:hypothetical protein